MRFRDDKEVKVGTYTFEHARIVQGCMLYAIFMGLFLIGALVNNDRIMGLLFLAVLLGYVTVVIGYWFKLRSLKLAIRIGILKMLVFPTSMIG